MKIRKHISITKKSSGVVLYLESKIRSHVTTRTHRESFQQPPARGYDGWPATHRLRQGISYCGARQYAWPNVARWRWIWRAGIARHNVKQDEGICIVCPPHRSQSIQSTCPILLRWKKNIIDCNSRHYVIDITLTMKCLDCFVSRHATHIQSNHGWRRKRPAFFTTKPGC